MIKELQKLDKTLEGIRKSIKEDNGKIVIVTHKLESMLQNPSDQDLTKQDLAKENLQDITSSIERLSSKMTELAQHLMELGQGLPSHSEEKKSETKTFGSLTPTFVDNTNL